MRAIKVKGLTICRIRRVYGLKQKTLFCEEKELLNSEETLPMRNASTHEGRATEAAVRYLAAKSACSSFVSVTSSTQSNLLHCRCPIIILVGAKIVPPLFFLPPTCLHNQPAHRARPPLHRSGEPREGPDSAAQNPAQSCTSSAGTDHT